MLAAERKVVGRCEEQEFLLNQLLEMAGPGER